ncbi:MAG: VOC family protein [Armatimonadetes bacterium]|nr:VOC family protein [Armatimonadota bacterium]
MPNPICHFEIMVPDPEKARAFYGQVFDWSYREDPTHDYIVIHTGADPNGGIMRTPPGVPVAASLNVYVRVDDIDATLKRVEAAGGHVIVSKTDIPGIGAFALFSDPDGVALGIFREV